MKASVILAGAATLALLTGGAQAQPMKEFPDVTDASFAQADGAKVLKMSLVVPAARKAVWDRFTTTAGYKTWAVPMASISPGLGGVIESSYDARAQVGDADNIRNQIVLFSPEHTLALRNIHAPKALPGAREFGDIITIIELEDAGPGATRVTLSAVGYKPGEPYDTLYKHFLWGNAYSLTKLKESFVKGPIDWKALEAQQQAQAASAKVTGSKP